MCRFLVVCALALIGAVGLHSEAHAQVEYVRVCDAYGAGFYYIPGTETCVNASSGETRRETPGGSTIFGQTELASRVGALEERMQDALAAAAIANALQDPDLVAGERAGVRINWGAAGSQSAIGFTGAMVFQENLFGDSGRLSGSAGIGFASGQVGGHVGLQLTW